MEKFEDFDWEGYVGSWVWVLVAAFLAGFFFAAGRDAAENIWPPNPTKVVVSMAGDEGGE